eukprot:339516_1
MSVETRSWNIHDTNRMVASLTSGFVQSMVGHPIDCIKVQMQKDAQTYANPDNFFKTTVRMYNENGIRAFFRGALSPSLGKMISYCVFFVTNGYLKDLLLAYRQPESGILSIGDTCLVGTLCGIILTPVMTPAEMIKVQLQFDVYSQGPLKYSGMIDCFKRLAKNRSLYRGTVATGCRLAPAWGVYLATYDGFNRWFDERATLGKIDTLSSLSASTRVIVGGGCAGIISWIASYPQDFIKTQIQGHEILRSKNLTRWKTTTPPRMRDVISSFYGRYGFRVFFRGLTPCLIRAFPANLTNFWVYESVLQFRERGLIGEDD